MDTKSKTVLLVGLLAVVPILAAESQAMATNLKTSVSIAKISSLVYHCDYMGPNQGNNTYRCYGVIGTCYVEWYAPNPKPDPYQPGATITSTTCVLKAYVDAGNLPTGVIVDSAQVPQWAVVAPNYSGTPTMTLADSGLILLNNGSEDSSCVQTTEGRFDCNGFVDATEYTWTSDKPRSGPTDEGSTITSATLALITVVS